jgi:hypothetical protein
MLKFITSLLRADGPQNDPEKAIDVARKEEISLERRLERIVTNLGRYKQKSDLELDELLKDIEIVIAFVEDALAAISATHRAGDATALLRRLKYNKTRIVNQREGRAA